jgi:hypothetical protein
VQRTRVGPIAIASATILAAAGVAFVTVRRRERPALPVTERVPPQMPERVRSFVTERFNPFVVRLGLVGGRRSPWSYLEHVGRISGTVYRTPVLPIVADNHVYVPLAYGVDVNWARNVRAAGHCRMQRHDHVLELDEPTVVGAGEHPGIPAWYRAVLERRGNRYLRLHVLTISPGGLGDVPVAAPAGLGDVPVAAPAGAGIRQPGAAPLASG